MQANWLFLGSAAALALGALGIALAPLIRGAGRGERRASYDIQIYRDQLRAVETDVARGALAPAEGAAIRLEVSRRLLAAADAETAEQASTDAPRRLSRLAAAGFGLGALALVGATYGDLGAPGLPDEPLQARLEASARARAERPRQAEAEARAAAEGPAAPALPPDSPDAALIERLRETVARRPGDLQGQRLLARSEASLGNWAAARAAQAQVVAILGDKSAPSDRVDLAEFMILAARGYVSPEAESLLAQALAAAPGDPAARYYSGLALLQGGRPDLAYDLWSRLLAEGPETAPWIGPIRQQMGQVAALAGRPAPAPTGPTAEQVEGAAAMSEADRAAMIEGMVAQLSERLAKDGGPPADWDRLIRSLAVLGRQEEAMAIWREAREIFAADPAALVMLRETATAAGLKE